MSTIRVARRRRFTTVDRLTLNDAALSFRARGVLVWLLDKPDDWRCSAEDVSAAGAEGRDAIRAALRELESAGYLVRERVQGDDGRWRTFTTVYERHELGSADATDGGIPAVGFPDVGQPDVGGPGPLPNTVTGGLEPKELPAAPAADAPGVVARVIAQGYWDWVKDQTGKAPVGVPFMGIVKLVEPFLVAGYDAAAVKVALAALYRRSRHLTRQSIEMELDGRGGRPPAVVRRLDDDRSGPAGRVAL